MVPFKRRIETHENVTAACSGSGAVSSAARTKSLLQKADADSTMLLICGFAGGLSPHLKAGDLIIPEKVLELGSRNIFLPDRELQQKSNRIPIQNSTIHSGSLISVNQVLSTAAEKRQTYLASGAEAVDMETAAAAKTANEHGVRWLSIRAITDGADDAMPFDFNKMTDADGQISRSKIVLSAVTHPWKIPALVKLGQRSSAAARCLSGALELILNDMLE